MIGMECWIKQPILSTLSSTSNYVFIYVFFKIFYSSNVFIFRHPKTVDSAKVFLAPFAGSVWLLIVASGGIFTILIRKLLVVTNDLHIMNTTGCGSMESKSSYSNSFLMAFGYLVQQGSVLDTISSETLLT